MNEQKQQPTPNKPSFNKNRSNNRNRAEGRKGQTSSQRNHNRRKAIAKKLATVAKAVAKAAEPKKQYLCVCHNAPARKPALRKQDKESENLRGLGHWRCSQTNKACKVTPALAKKEEPTVVTVDVAAAEARVVEAVTAQ